MKTIACATALGLFLIACGGGGGGDRAALYTLDARLYQSLSGVVDDQGGVRHDECFVGDTTGDVAERAFYTFIVDDLPDGARVQRAVFSAQQYLVAGHPFEDLGDVVVDHVAAEPTLDAADHDRPEFTLDIGTLCTRWEPGLFSLDVTDAVRADRDAGRGVTTLRLRARAATDDDGTRDQTGYSRPMWTEDHRRASLVIEYTLP